MWVETEDCFENDDSEVELIWKKNCSSELMWKQISICNVEKV